VIVSSSYSDRIKYLDPKGSNWNRAAVLRRFLVDPSRIVHLGSTTRDNNVANGMQRPCFKASPCAERWIIKNRRGLTGTPLAEKKC